MGPAGWVSLVPHCQRPSLWAQDSRSLSSWECWLLPLTTHAQWSFSGTDLQKPNEPASLKVIPISRSRPTSNDWSMGGQDYKGPHGLPQCGATLKWSGILSMNGRYRWCSGKESACQCRRWKRRLLDPWIGKIPWSRKWQLTPVFLSSKAHGQRSLVGYSPRDCRVGHEWARSQAAKLLWDAVGPKSKHLASKLFLPSDVSVPDKAHHLFISVLTLKMGQRKRYILQSPDQSLRNEKV